MFCAQSTTKGHILSGRNKMCPACIVNRLNKPCLNQQETTSSPCCCCCFSVHVTNATLSQHHQKDSAPKELYNLPQNVFSPTGYRKRSKRKIQVEGFCFKCPVDFMSNVSTSWIRERHICLDPPQRLPWLIRRPWVRSPGGAGRGTVFLSLRVNSWAALFVPCVTADIQHCAHVKDPISIGRKSVRLTAGGMEYNCIRKHSTHRTFF